MTTSTTTTTQLQYNPEDPTPTPPHDPPPPPIPSSDPRLSIVVDSNGNGNGNGNSNDEKSDLFKLSPADALQLLSASVELLVRITGDIPPTPPPKTPTYPQMSNMQAEKVNIARSHSEKNLARLRAQVLKEEEEERKRQQQEQEQQRQQREREEQEQQQRQQWEQQQQQQQESNGSAVGMNNLQAYSVSMSTQLIAQQEATLASTSPQTTIDGVRLKHETDQFQDAMPHQNQQQQPPHSEPYIIVGSDSQPINLQHGAITRKFYSKNEPPISVNQYLLRLHQFCPMSTAVYLATSLYIHRLAVEERAIPVTRRNAHRLVLAGLRVAMKALEDLSYPHTKIAKVGGVSEVELARLEISFCFLAGFELVVGEEVLRRHWETLRDGRVQQMIDGMEVPALRLERKPREITTTTTTTHWGP
ncbi:PHO85 cyclin-7 [Cladobotryum mycophilum]|uniref:PHO85 cyclin-7 n=1 Tax=Cladobotryum mycophilum TaxID=491253 RepID=A0ABR0SD03_9HYPO